MFIWFYQDGCNVFLKFIKLWGNCDLPQTLNWESLYIEVHKRRPIFMTRRPVVDWVDKHTLPDSWKECLETQRKRTHLEADCHEMKFEEITFTNMRISMLYCINIETVWEYQDSAEKYLWQTYPTTRIPNSSVCPSVTQKVSRKRCHVSSLLTFSGWWWVLRSGAAKF